MEASTTKSFTQARPMSELLPDLRAILSKDAIQNLTAKKQPRKTMLQTRTTEKMFKPMTLAEMRTELSALKPYSPRRASQAIPSSKKRGWNSSVKVDNKTKSYTSSGQMKNNSVRKVLNFQTKPKPGPMPRITVCTTDTPKFPKPEFRAKKAIALHARNNDAVRISGISNIPQTPLESSKPIKCHLTSANKENNPYRPPIKKKPLIQYTPVIKHMKSLPSKIDTPLLNSSWKSGSDASFLQKEKEIHDIEEKVKALAEESTLENIAEVSPPVSTPFKEYRSVQEYFNNSSEVESSALYNDNTIMCFEKTTIVKENSDKEESVIMSLCDLFNKATVTSTEKLNTELDNLLDVEKQTVNNIKMIESGINMLNNIKQSHLNSLVNVRRLLEEKRNRQKHFESDTTLIAEGKDLPRVNVIRTPSGSPIISRPCSVIKHSRSPSYKIPKKNLGLRKKIIFKSLPNVSNLQTPIKDIEGKALNMYMDMKKQMNFLSTPMVHRDTTVPDTPALTSHNLQKQLDKLFGS